jgi:cytochrome c-type biogenesis protein CcmF
MYLEIIAPDVGNFSLSLIALFGLLFPVLLLYYSRNRQLSFLYKFSLNGSILIFTLAIICKLCLIYSFIVSDYSVSNVYYNSHHLKPLIYKISGSWGNHEGSMLLLILIIAGYNIAFNLLSKTDYQDKIIVSSSQNIIIALFALYSFLSSNPFTRIFPVADHGMELNPLLQDIGLAMHPPMLYIGYIGFSIIFSLAISALLREKIDKNYAKICKNWLFFSWSFLTLGIALGSWWAYRELGWGGFWFWDPVENVSLMPWIAGLILIHSLVMLERKNLFKIWTIFLSILSFILCLLGIFLVRSGVLTSVHSFAVDANRGFFIIALLSIIGGVSFFIMALKWPKEKKYSSKIAPISKEGSIVINNYLTVISLFVIVLGTIYPIFSQLLFNEFIAIGPQYYNKIFSILIIPFLLFLAISTNQNFSRKNNLKQLFNIRNIIATSLALIITLLTNFYEAKGDIFAKIIIFLSLLTLFLILIKDNFKKNIVSNLSHIAFIIIILGVVLGSYFSQIKELNLKVGQSITMGNYNIKFKEVEFFHSKNYIVRQGNFSITNNKNFDSFYLKPQLRYYPISDQTTNEADIKSNLFRDLYIVIGNKDEFENYAVRIYYKPFILLIWLGSFILFCAMNIYLISRNFIK